MGSSSSRSTSVSTTVSSISVVSVPFDDVAMGEGSAISLGLEAKGEDCAGG